MIKSEYKETTEQENYWYNKSIFHRSNDDIDFERYDRPIGGIHLEDYGRDTLSDYESCINHFID